MTQGETPLRPDSPSEPTPAPVIFGEALFDVFPDREVLGGAPVNVAWTLARLGHRPLLISRAGQDERGRRLGAALREGGLPLLGLQRDGHAPTGIVEVTLGADGPSFRIAGGQAWDAIDPAAAVAAVEAIEAKGLCARLLYHGTLAVRSERSRAALTALRERVSGPRFVDVNLRAPWFEVDHVRELIQGASVVKLNDDELATLTGAAITDDAALADAARRLRSERGIECLVVTAGARGLRLYSEALDGALVPSSPVSTLVDTVGAGDAVSAVLIDGLLSGAEVVDLRDAAARATQLAARICAVPGATTNDAAVYRL